MHAEEFCQGIGSTSQNDNVSLKGIVMSAVVVFSRVVGCLVCAGTFALGLLLAAPAVAEDVKLGILFGATGPVASAVPALLDAVKLAVDEVNANGGVLKGQKLQTIVEDTKGTAQGSIDAATKLAKADNVAAIVGGLTSVTLMAAAHGVTIPNGVLLTVTESGFDRIPLARRLKAFTANEQGWSMVVKLIEDYLVQAP